MKYLITLVAMLSFYTGVAQQRNNLKCPRPFKADKTHFFSPVKSYVNIELGENKSFLYANKGGDLTDNYSFISFPKVYGGASYNINIYKNIEAFIGLQYAQNKQGIAFIINENGNKLKEKNYNTSDLFRFRLGLSYALSPSFKISLASVLVHSTYSVIQTTGDYSLSTNTNISYYQYTWYNTGWTEEWYLGGDLNVEYGLFKNSDNKILHRLYLNLLLSADFKHSVPVSGKVELDYDGSSHFYHGSLNPSLMYAGLAVSYRLFERYK